MKKIFYGLVLSLLSLAVIPSQIHAQTYLDFLAVAPASAYDADFQAVIDKATSDGVTIPTTLNLVKLNAQVLRDKANGLWARCAIYYIFTTGDPGETNREFSKYNYKDPLHFKWNITESSTNKITYDGCTGYWGNSWDATNGGYLLNPFIPLTDGANIDVTKAFTQNSAGWGFHSLCDLQDATAIASSIGTGSSGLFASGKNGTNQGSYRVNQTSSSSWTNLAIAGSYHFRRTSSSALFAYKNGLLVSSASTTSAAVSDTQLALLATNTSGSISGPGKKNITRFYLGGPMTGLEAAISSDWDIFMSTILTVRPATLPQEQKIMDNAAHAWFIKNKAVYHAGSGKTFFGTTHDELDGNNYTQWFSELNHSTGIVTKTRVGTVSGILNFDDHNEPSVLIRASDSRLFICYAEHAANFIRYRISTNPLDASAFGSEQTIDRATFNPDGSVTYLSCYQASDGAIYIFFRDIDLIDANGWSYLKSTDNGATFPTYQRIASGGPGPLPTYAITTQYQDKVHFIMADNPVNTPGGVNLVSHFYIDLLDETLHATNGTDITANKPLSLSEMTVIDTQTSPSVNWIEDVTVDGTGKPRALMTVFPSGETTSYTTKYCYYSEWTGSAWTTPYQLHTERIGSIETGSRFIYGAYPSLSHFSRSNPDKIVASKDAVGTYGTHLELFLLQRNSSTSFTVTQKTFNSPYDNWRPLVTAAPTRNVFWLNKIIYNDYQQSFYQQLMNATID